MDEQEPLAHLDKLLEKACLAIASLGSEVSRCGDTFVELGQEIRKVKAEMDRAEAQREAAQGEQAQLDGSARVVPRYREH